MKDTVFLDGMTQTAEAGEGWVLVTNRLQFLLFASLLLSEYSSKCFSKLLIHCG